VADHLASQTGKLTSGRLLTRNTILNLCGQTIPILVAFIAVPVLVKGLGVDRFGVLTLVWLLIGYFGLFDLGLGQALTQLVAEKLGSGQEDGFSGLIWTALSLMLLLGFLGALIIGLLSAQLVYHWLKIPTAIQRETLQAFRLLAISIPFVVSTAGFQGILEAQQRFDLINAIRVPMGLFNYIGPLLVLPFSDSLIPIIAVLATGRFLSWVIYLATCLRVTPTLRSDISLQRSVVRPLISFGSWMTVSSVIGPLMVYLDRFLIGSYASVSAVTYYATPEDAVTKLSVFPGALVNVLFPAFATSFTQDRKRTGMLFARGVKYIFLVLFPPVLIIVALAYTGLDIWLGADFAQNSMHVLRWLAAGVFLNGLAAVPFALVRGVGRPDISAKLHLVELPLYLLVLWWLLRSHGIEGAAMAWFLRMAIDTLVLFGVAHWLLKIDPIVIRRLVLALGVALIILGIATLPSTLFTEVLFVVLTLLAFTGVAWYLVLTAEERALVQNYAKAAQARGFAALGLRSKRSKLVGVDRDGSTKV
jgi:O-antigen/teichoic acid export membrane protein